MKAKKRVKSSKIEKIFAIIIILLAAAVIILYEKSAELKEQISGFHNEYERGVLEGVDDYTSMIIDLLKTCQPVTMQSSKGSATVIDTGCFSK